MTWAIIFWISVLLVLHSYLLYPLLLRIFSAGKKGNEDVYGRADDLPFVSVIIAAYNEEAHIGRKIISIYKGSYPSDRFEVLIGSDASDDATANIVASCREEHPSLKFFEFKERRGIIRQDSFRWEYHDRYLD